VDLRGTGDKVLLVGCNGFGGLHAVRSDGNLLWQNRSVGNVWRVSGIDARGGRQGLALCTGDDIEVFVFDAAGKKVGQLRYEGHWIRSFAAAELNTAGLRQVLALCSIHGKQQIDAVAMDLNGKILWKYPADWGGSLLAPIVAADVAGTGTKQWLLPGRSESLIVLDAAGRLVARIDRGQRLWRTWTAVARNNKPGWVVTSDLEKLVAYKLNLP
jgi:outer membrane protein assembly factor BamB